MKVMILEMILEWYWNDFEKFKSGIRGRKIKRFQKNIFCEERFELQIKMGKTAQVGVEILFCNDDQCKEADRAETPA